MLSMPSGFLRIEGGAASLEVNCNDLLWVVRRGQVERQFPPTWRGLNNATALIHCWTRLQRRTAPSMGQLDFWSASIGAARFFDREDIWWLLLHTLGAAAEERLPDIGLLRGSFQDPLTTPPLVYSAPFLRETYLQRDVFQFRAAAIATAKYEAFFDGGYTADCTQPVDAAERQVFRLRDWRSLFLARGSAQRSVNVTLGVLGAVAEPDDLCMLAHIPLERPVTSTLSLSLMAQRMWLKQRRVHGESFDHGTATDDCVAIQRATDDEIRECLDVLRRALGKPIGAEKEHVHDLAALLNNTRDVSGKPLRRRVASALERWRGNKKERWWRQLPTALPPIPLPSTPGIRFLSTGREVMEEGLRMNHCIGTLVPGAIDGTAFLFHVDLGDQAASVEINADGEVVQAFGPRNARNAASEWGGAELAQWAKAFPRKPYVIVDWSDPDDDDFWMT